MSHKKHYQAVFDHDAEHPIDIYCDVLPLGGHHVFIRERHHKRAAKTKWLIYDPNSPNSIQAALEMAARHNTDNARVLTFLNLHNGTFVWGKDLIELFGTAALERVRELRTQYGWPIETKSSHGNGAWWYGLFLGPPPPRKRILQRLR